MDRGVRKPSGSQPDAEAAHVWLQKSWCWLSGKGVKHNHGQQCSGTGVLWGEMCPSERIFTTTHIFRVWRFMGADPGPGSARLAVRHLHPSPPPGTVSAPSVEGGCSWICNILGESSSHWPFLWLLYETLTFLFPFSPRKSMQFI